jgi:hypothetical protein
MSATTGLVGGGFPNPPMSDPIIVEMQAITRLASEPWEPGDSVRVAISRAAHALGLSYRRARSFWYGDAVSVRAFEADQIRAAERAFLVKRRRRLQRELTVIEERLGLDRRDVDSDGETAGTRVRPWDALRDADRRRP